MSQWQGNAETPTVTTGESTTAPVTLIPTSTTTAPLQQRNDLSSLVQNAFASVNLGNQAVGFTNAGFLPLPSITTTASELQQPPSNDENLRLLANLAATQAPQQQAQHNQLLLSLPATTAMQQQTVNPLGSPIQSMVQTAAPEPAAALNPMLLAATLIAAGQQQELNRQLAIVQAQQLGQLVQTTAVANPQIDLLQQLQAQRRLSEVAHNVTTTEQMNVHSSIVTTQSPFQLNISGGSQQLNTSNESENIVGSIVTTAANFHLTPTRRGPGRPRRSTESGALSSSDGFMRPRASTLSSSGGPVKRPYINPARQTTGTAPRSVNINRDLVRVPTSNDSQNTISTFLMLFNKCMVDVGFCRKALDSLIKKLKDKQDQLDTLINVVNREGAEAGGCITIQRTLDGRLQVAGRKGFPHVVYGRIFRWPDLHKNEVRHLPMCTAGFDMKGDVVCVNPYHYERVTPHASSPDLSPILNSSNLSALGPKRSIGAEDFRRLILGAAAVMRDVVAPVEETEGSSGIGNPTQPSPSLVPPDPANAKDSDSSMEEDQPAAKKSRENHPSSAELQSPLRAAPAADVLSALQRGQEERENPAITSPAIFTVYEPKVDPSVVMLQNALKRATDHQQQEAMETARAVVNASKAAGHLLNPPRIDATTAELIANITRKPIMAIAGETPRSSHSAVSFLESRRSTHNSRNVFCERLRADLNQNVGENEEYFNLVDFCKHYPLSTSALMELFGDLTYNAKLDEIAAQKAEALGGIVSLRELKFPDLDSFTSPKSADDNKIISSPSSSTSSPRHPIADTMQHIHSFIMELKEQLDVKKVQRLVPLLDLIEIAEKQSVVLAMQTMLAAMNPGSSLDNYSTPSKPKFRPEPAHIPIDSSCSFKYFEFGQQIGPVFHSTRPVVSVGHAVIDKSSTDGQSFDHFDLANAIVGLTGSNEDNERALHQFRRQIGRGFFVECNRDGEIYVKNLASTNLFMESPYLDREAMVMPHDRIHCIYPNQIVKIFDMRQAFDMMCFWVTHQTRAMKRGSTFMNPEQFVSQLRSICLIRCSFNAIWKSERFPTFASAPCTVEFYVNRALRLLDEILRNPRKAHVYLRTGKLSLENPANSKANEPTSTCQLATPSTVNETPEATAIKMPSPLPKVLFYDSPFKAIPPALSTLDSNTLQQLQSLMSSFIERTPMVTATSEIV
ncbi:MH1 domain-containing protein [Aphelenchoides besseyi]|nr:MH1 domain-containing protein [Aphelenchoides besseyi]